ncbi:MAG: AzlD domain-containing protein [Actinomycetota bacterium]|nr:AzlD domain-containing protein [Actinomycetota bacterium]
MSTGWAVVVGLGAVTILLKAAGPLLVRDHRLSPRLLGVLRMLAPALLAALVVTQGFTAQGELSVDGRAVGLLAAAGALLLRLPPLAVILSAAAATALVRYLGA